MQFSEVRVEFFGTEDKDVPFPGELIPSHHVFAVSLEKIFNAKTNSRMRGRAILGW
jgi:hypothetical protein